MNIAAEKHWYKNWWGIILIVAAVFLVSSAFAVAFYIINYLQSFNPAIKAGAYIPNSTIEGEENYWLGATEPKITIVEFADFNCPYCKKTFPKIREIVSENKDVRLIFRDYPVISEFSARLALAARCAGEQGLFWVMHDKLYLNQGLKTEAELQEMFKQIGGDETRFRSCLENNKYLPQIEKDLNDGESLKLTGTPTFFFNGMRVSGDIPYEYLINLINKF